MHIYKNYIKKTVKFNNYPKRYLYTEYTDTDIK